MVSLSEDSADSTSPKPEDEGADVARPGCAASTGLPAFGVSWLGLLIFEDDGAVDFC